LQARNGSSGNGTGNGAAASPSQGEQARAAEAGDRPAAMEEAGDVAFRSSEWMRNKIRKEEVRGAPAWPHGLCPRFSVFVCMSRSRRVRIGGCHLVVLGAAC
jgi:hypothetical protein